MKKQRLLHQHLPKPPVYSEKTSFFSPKEIIFRSGGRARVWQISPKAQIIFLILAVFLAVWSFYSYHFYTRSGSVINRKEHELSVAKDAYINLISEFMALHENVNEILESDKQDSKEIEDYKKKATVFEDKIKQITDNPKIVSENELDKKKNISDALLQRDIAASERDALKNQVQKMEETFNEINKVQQDIFDRLQILSSNEVNKLKGTFNEINAALKKHGLYFNPMANKKDSKGGIYLPQQSSLNDKKLNDKIAIIYKNADDYEYYKEVMRKLPLGKPIWSYWVSSHYGARNDPFRRSKAYHKGVDLASRTGNKILVKAAGKVTRADFANGYGNLVIINHGNGFETKYAHLHKIYVKKGQTVKYNDVIGEVGSTGRSTGPHLHYEVLYRGVSVNPMPFIQAKSS